MSLKTKAKVAKAMVKGKHGSLKGRAEEIFEEYLEEMLQSKEANFQMLSNVGKSLVVFGIMIGLGVMILTEFLAQAGDNSTAANYISQVLNLFGDLTGWAAIVLIVIIGYIVLKYLNVFGSE